MRKTLTYNARTDVFTLELTDRHGTDIQMFTVPADAPVFNVCGVDLVTVRNVLRAPDRERVLLCA